MERKQDEYFKQSEILFDTHEDMRVEDNDNEATVELYKGCEVVYENTI